MKKNTHKLYVQHRSSTYSEGSIEISNTKQKSSEHFTYVDLGETECEFSFDADGLENKIAAEKIKTLEQYKQKFMAETEVKLQNLDEQIAKLKCLEVK